MSYSLSEKSYLLSEISRSNSTWPLPCIVEDGFYGDTLWNTVSSGETILLSALEKRRRVLALSSDQNYYSIPHDYPLRFSVVLSNQKETTPKPISEILVKHQLPVTLKVQQDHLAMHSVKGHKVLFPVDQIVVIGSYDEKYVVGNCIVKGALQNEILLFPTFLKIRVRVIEGAENTSDTKWQAIQKTWKEESQRNMKSPTLPPLNIVVFESLPPEIESKQSQESNEIYETLEPSSYIAVNFNSDKSENNEYTVLGEISPLPDDKSALKSDKTASRQITNSGARSEFHSELQDAVFTKKFSSSTKATTSTGAGHGPQIQINPEGSRTPPRPPPKLSKSISQGKPTPDIRPPVKLHPEADAKDIVDFREQFSFDFQDEVSRDCEIEPRTNSRIRSLKDVPTSVKSLNCDEIADCLRLLKMSKYSEQFIANQIDGSLLEELQESILTDELQVTPLHAKKLIMFAQKGWRPT